MPEQEEPQEEPIEVLEEETDEPDNTAAWVFIGAFVVITLLVTWGLVSVAPAISNWINDIKTPDFLPVACELPEVGEYCEMYAEDLVSLVLSEVPACELPPAPACADLNWWPAETADIPTYLDNADKLIERMNEAAWMHDSLARLMTAQGYTKTLMNRAYTDKSWIALRDDFDRRVTEIGGDFDDFWPPPPSNSTSSLLDAHARLMMAYRHLDTARDLVWTGVRLNDPFFVYRYADTVMDQMRYEIDLAQTFGLRNYR